MSNSKIIFSVLLIVGLFFSFNQPALAKQKDWRGQFVLQVESKGEAWYISQDNKKYYLGPIADFIKNLGKISIGINNKNLTKIQVADFNLSGVDNDADGLNNMVELGFGTDRFNKDTDKDGKNDLTEITNGFSPLNKSTLSIVDKKFTNKQKGKIFLQVESLGEIWYVNPIDGKRYFLGDSNDVLNLLAKCAEGIYTADLNKIPDGEKKLSVANGYSIAVRVVGQRTVPIPAMPVRNVVKVVRTVTPPPIIITPAPVKVKDKPTYNHHNGDNHFPHNNSNNNPSNVVPAVLKFTWPSAWQMSDDKKMNLVYALNTGLNSSCVQNELNRLGKNINNVSASQSAEITKTCRVCSDYCAPFAELLRFASVMNSGSVDFGNNSEAKNLWNKFNSCSSGDVGNICRGEALAMMGNITGSNCHGRNGYDRNNTDVSDSNAGANASRLYSGLKIGGYNYIDFRQLSIGNSAYSSVYNFLNTLRQSNTTATVILRNIVFKKVTDGNGYKLQAETRGGHRIWVREAGSNNEIYYRHSGNTTSDTVQYLSQLPTVIDGYYIDNSKIYSNLLVNSASNFNPKDTYGNDSNLSFDSNGYLINSRTGKLISYSSVQETYLTQVK